MYAQVKWSCDDLGHVHVSLNGIVEYLERILDAPGKPDTYAIPQQIQVPTPHVNETTKQHTVSNKQTQPTAIATAPQATSPALTAPQALSAAVTAPQMSSANGQTVLGEIV